METAVSTQRAHPSLLPHTENLQACCCYSSFESPGSAEPQKGTDSSCISDKLLVLAGPGIEEERRDHLQM